MIHTGQTQHHNVSTTSCCSTASKQMHHCCPLENNVEFIDCVQGRACPSVSTKSAPSRGVSGSKANTWFLGPRESTSKRFGGFYRVTLCYIHPFNGPLSGTTRVNRYQKGKTNLDFTEAETVSCISWAICKSAPRSRQITTPASHHSVFYRPDALHATQPTASKH